LWLFFYRHSFNKNSKHKRSHYRNVSTDPLGSGGGYFWICRAHFWNHWITRMQNNPSWKTNSPSATQQNTNHPIIWTQKTGYSVDRMLQLDLIQRQINLLQTFPTELRYFHFYAATRQAVYAQPIIMFINTMFDADSSKTCKQSQNVCEWITLFMLHVLFYYILLDAVV